MSAPTPHIPTYVRLAVFLVGVFAFLQVYSIQAVLPTIVADFGVSAATAGLAVGITVLAIGLMSPIVGVISDKLGRKTLIVPAIIGLAAPTFAMFFVENIFWLNIARFLQGLFVPAMTVVLLAYIAEEFPHKVASVTATYVMGTVLGGFLGRFILGYLNDFMGWRSAFLVMGTMTLLGAITVALCLPNSKNFSKNTQTGILLKFRTHLGNYDLLILCFLGGCVLFSLVGAFTFVNLHLAAAPYSLSTSQLANIFAIYLIGMIITPLSTKLIDKFGTHTTLFLAVGLSMFGVLLTLGKPLWLIILGLTAVSTGVFITQTATISQLSKVVNHGRSLANGLYYSGYYLGGMVGSWACGLAFTQYNWLGVVGLIFLVQCVGLIMIWQSKNNLSPQS